MSEAVAARVHPGGADATAVRTIADTPSSRKKRGNPGAIRTFRDNPIHDWGHQLESTDVSSQSP